MNQTVAIILQSQQFDWPPDHHTSIVNQRNERQLGGLSIRRDRLQSSLERYDYEIRKSNSNVVGQNQ